MATDDSSMWRKHRRLASLWNMILKKSKQKHIRAFAVGFSILKSLVFFFLFWTYNNNRNSGNQDDPAAPRIFDCFIFNGEHDLLLFRLKSLYPVVDYFVIAESDKTFPEGKPKLLHLKENKGRLYGSYAKKIRHVLIGDDEGPAGEEAKEEEQQQYSRNALSEGLVKMDPAVRPQDLIVLSDVDEVPDPRTLRILKDDRNHSLVGVHALEMQSYIYSFEFVRKNKITTAKVLDGSTYLGAGIEEGGKDNLPLSMDKIRGLKIAPILPYPGGWHLGNFGGSIESIQENLRVQSSAQSKRGEGVIDEQPGRQAVEEVKALFGRDGDAMMLKVPLQENPYLPEYYQMLVAKTS